MTIRFDSAEGDCREPVRDVADTDRRLPGSHDTPHEEARASAYAVTYDDDFIEEVPPEQYRAVFFFEDDTTSATDVAAIVHAVSIHYPHEEVSGLQKIGWE